jgi:hypothetical protein
MMKYLSVEEQEGMLNEFWEFDRNMIHEKYRHLAANFEIDGTVG